MKLWPEIVGEYKSLQRPSANSLIFLIVTLAQYSSSRVNGNAEEGDDNAGIQIFGHQGQDEGPRDSSHDTLASVAGQEDDPASLSAEEML